MCRVPERNQQQDMRKAFGAKGLDITPHHQVVQRPSELTAPMLK